MGRFLILGVAFLAVFGWGMGAAHYRVFPYPQIIDLKQYVDRELIGRAPRRETRTQGRQRVACPNSANALVILAIGQSNAANFGNTPSVAPAGVLVFFKGRCYRAQDPMLGAAGGGGSPWPLLGERLASASGKTVVFLTHGVGGTSVGQWAQGKLGLIDYSLAQIGALKKSNLKIDLVLWHQGEADAHLGTDAAAYTRLLSALIAQYREAGVAAPWVVARVSRIGERTSAPVRAGQARVINRDARVFAGPDSDRLAGPTHRFDGVHFNGNGTRALAAAWFAALMQAGLVKRSATGR